MAEGRKFRKRLEVTACTLKKTGTNKKGKPWAMYEVAAVDDGGAPVDVKLKSWDNLLLHQLIDYDVTEEVSDQYGTSYWLRPPADKKGLSPAASAQEGLAQLQARVDALEQVCAQLVAAVNGGTPVSISPPPTSSPAAGVAGFGSDSDIPF